MSVKSIQQMPELLRRLALLRSFRGDSERRDIIRFMVGDLVNILRKGPKGRAEFRRVMLGSGDSSAYRRALAYACIARRWPDESRIGLPWDLCRKHTPKTWDEFLDAEEKANGVGCYERTLPNGGADLIHEEAVP